MCRPQSPLLMILTWSKVMSVTASGHPSPGPQNRTQGRTVLASIGGLINPLGSPGSGNTFEGPYITSGISPSQDAEFSIGCRCVIFTFSGPNTSAYEKRYDWYILVSEDGRCSRPSRVAQ